MKLLGKTVELHLSKILMEHLSGHEDKLSAYRLYLKSCFNPNVCQANLSVLNSKLLADFYKKDHPLAQPKYFDFFDGPDLSRLEKAVQKHIVIIKKNGSRDAIKIHDRRIFETFQETVFLQLKDVRYGYELYSFEGDYNARLSEQYFIKCCSYKFNMETNCYFDMINQALQQPTTNHQHSKRCLNFNQFLTNPPEIDFTLASHIKSKITTQQRDPKVANHFFAVLTTSGDVAKGPVLSVTNDKSYIYLLHENLQKNILNTKPKIRNPATCKEERRPFVDYTSVVVPRKDCDCQCCQEKHLYLKNMEEAGPQALYKIKMSGFDQLKMLGLFNKHTEDLLLEVCKLSMAAFDVEAMTIGIESDCGNEDLNFPFETVGQTKFPRMAIARQVPILISWTDNLRIDEGKEPLVYKYNENDEKEMIGNFVEDLLEEKERCFETKHEMLAELFGWLSIFEEAHYKFFNVSKEVHETDTEEIVATRKNAAYAWSYGLFGLFATHLESMAMRFVLWGFNCEAYDLVILCSMLTTYLKSTGRSCMEMQREGSKVKSFSFKGIQMKEAKKLLGPGFSLDTFSAMCGLENPEEKKGKFPFDKLRSNEFLLEKRLPSNAKDWKNTLNPKASLSQEEVDKVLQLYDEKGFETVGQYLEYYLKLDVIILLKSMTKLTKGFYDTLGVHAMDSQKYTIPSLATLGTQTYLMRNKRIGNFFANNATLYSVR
jgi:hypothetical protein